MQRRRNILYSHMEKRSWFPSEMQRCSADVNGILPHSLYHKSQPAVSKSTPKLNWIQYKQHPISAQLLAVKLGGKSHLCPFKSLPGIRRCEWGPLPELALPWVCIAMGFSVTANTPEVYCASGFYFGRGTWPLRRDQVLLSLTGCFDRREPALVHSLMCSETLQSRVGMTSPASQAVTGIIRPFVCQGKNQIDGSKTVQSAFFENISCRFQLPPFFVTSPFSDKQQNQPDTDCAVLTQHSVSVPDPPLLKAEQLSESQRGLQLRIRGYKCDLARSAEHDKSFLCLDLTCSEMSFIWKHRTGSAVVRCQVSGAASAAQLWQGWTGCTTSPEAQSITISVSFLFLRGNTGTWVC